MDPTRRCRIPQLRRPNWIWKHSNSQVNFPSQISLFHFLWVQHFLRINKQHLIFIHCYRFRPPDACYIELLRFRVRPPKNRELPLQVRTSFSVSGNKVELRSDVLVPGYISRKYGQIPCEDVAIRFPIPEAWIYMFRVEKHFRYGSVKSSHRRMGKIKGIERFLGAVDNLEPTLIEVSSGSAKYEHHHRAIVWRMPRLPKEGQGTSII